MPHSITYTPRLRVTIKSADGHVILDNIEQDIISLATNKAYGRANGTWQMLLTFRSVRDGKRYHEIIRTDDIITIELDPGNGEGFSPVMMGLVDRVARTRQGGQDAIIQHVKVSGQDMGKLFIKHDIAWDIVKYEQDMASSKFNQIFVPNQTGGTKQYASLNRLFNPQLQTGTAAQMVESLFKVCFANVLAPMAPYFTVNTLSALEDRWQINQPNMLTAQGISIWEVMKRASHFPWNMLHCDTDTAKVGLFNLILERQPIDSNGKLARTGDQLHAIEDREIVADDLGINDSERVNFLFYYPAMYQYATNYVADVAMIHPDLTRYDKDTDENGIPRHGYCSHVINDYFVPFPDVDSANEKEALAKFGQLTNDRTETFWQWYHRNHELESGTITVHGRPDIRAGHGLLVRQGQTREYKEYLIEQVAHQYDVWPTPRFNTVLHVTRGQKAPLAKIDEARRPRR